MIIVAGVVAVSPERHDAMIHVIGELIGPTRAEEGCLEFGFWADLGERGRFHVFEVWESRAHFASHLATPHLQAFRAERSRLEARVDLKRYEAAELTQA